MALPGALAIRKTDETTLVVNVTLDNKKVFAPGYSTFRTTFKGKKELIEKFPTFVSVNGKVEWKTSLVSDKDGPSDLQIDPPKTGTISRQVVLSATLGFPPSPRLQFVGTTSNLTTLPNKVDPFKAEGRYYK